MSGEWREKTTEPSARASRTSAPLPDLIAACPPPLATPPLLTTRHSPLATPAVSALSIREVVVDDEFHALCPPLADEEREQLLANVMRDGFRDPVMAWSDGRLLLDGHNRREIWEQVFAAEEGGPEPSVRGLSFDSRDRAKEWIIRNQFGRRNLNAMQRAELALKLEPLIAARAKANQRKGGGSGPSGKQNSADPTATRDELAKVAGVSHDTISRAKAILENADSQTVDSVRSGKKSINEAYKFVTQKKRRESLVVSPDQKTPACCTVDDLAEVARGRTRFATIYADPPWKYGNQSSRAATDDHYGTMTVEEICALPVEQLASDAALLWLWTTNGFLVEALTRVIPAWGFEFKSVLVWCKPQMGTGNYVRVSHEFLLIASRGGLRPDGKNQTSWLVSERERHSAKPNAFREIVEHISPGPRIELFARETRPRWTVWGNEIPRNAFQG
jgi:N6-adenosine-specific RNA methylase IME4